MNPACSPKRGIKFALADQPGTRSGRGLRLTATLNIAKNAT
jgi:hypothetical protein